MKLPWIKIFSLQQFLQNTRSQSEQTRFEIKDSLFPQLLHTFSIPDETGGSFTIEGWVEK